MKRGLTVFVVLAFVLMSFGVLAEDNIINTSVATGFNELKSYTWLHTESKKEGLSVEALSMSILALVSKPQYDLTSQVVALNTKANPDAQCWPAGACTTRDTAYALLALKSVGTDVSKGLIWLNKTLLMDSAGLKNWVVVIDSKQNGTCKVGFGDVLKPFEIKNNKIGNKYTISLSEVGVVNKPLQTINFDCSAISGEVVVALGYDKSQTERFIVGAGIKSATGSLTIPNGCFPMKSSGACDFDATLYTSWALSEMGEDVNNYGTYVYLETSQMPSDQLKLAFLSRYLEASVLNGATLIPTYYIDSLVNLQKSDGSWNGDVKTTSVAAFALTPTDKADKVANARAFLEKRIGNKEYWTTNLADNAWALIAMSGVNAFGTGYVSGATLDTSSCSTLDDCAKEECKFLDYCQPSTCSNGIQDSDELGVDCGGVCPACTPGGQQPSWNDTVSECTIDMDCGEGKICENGICTFSTPTAPECTADAECSDGKNCVGGKCITMPKKESESSLAWLWILIILILLIGGGAYFYIYWIKTGKFKFGKSKGTTSFDDYKKQRETFVSSRPSIQAPVQQPASRPAAEKPVARKDDELELALKKAEKILHGK